jgi:hypothetical protein
MSDTELILEEIRALRKDVREDINKAWDAIEEQRKCNNRLNNRQAMLEGAFNQMRNDRADTLVILGKHMDDKDKHFNPYFNEGYWEKMKRKKPEIATSITLGGIIFGFTLALLNYIGVI